MLLCSVDTMSCEQNCYHHPREWAHFLSVLISVHIVLNGPVPKSLLAEWISTRVRLNLDPFTFGSLMESFQGTYRNFDDKRIVIVVGTLLMAGTFSVYCFLYLYKKCVRSLQCKMSVKYKSNKIKELTLNIPFCKAKHPSYILLRIHLYYW